MNCRPVAWIRGLFLLCFAACLMCALAQTIAGGNLIALTPGFVLEQRSAPHKTPAARQDAPAPSNLQNAPSAKPQCEQAAPPLPRTDTVSRFF